MQAYINSCVKFQEEFLNEKSNEMLYGGNIMIDWSALEECEMKYVTSIS